MASALKMGLLGAAAGFLEGSLDLWKTERARAAKELEAQRLQQLHDRDQAEQYARQDQVYAQRRGDELTDAERRRQQELDDQKTRRQQEVSDRSQDYGFRASEAAKARAETAADRRAAAELAVANRKGERIKAKLPSGDIGYVDPATGRFDTDANGAPLIAPPPSADPMSLLMGLDGGSGGPASPAAPVASAPLRDRNMPGSSRDNPLLVSGPQGLNNLPRGTWVRTPDGMVRQF